MVLGHYGVAFAAKRLTPRTSLGTSVLAAQWLDELWPILVVAGVEQVAVSSAPVGASTLDFVYYPFSHSLAAAVVWSIVFGGLYFLSRRDRRSALIVGLLVLSHWVLDFPMHLPDLPLWPGSSTRVGLGAWRSFPLTIFLELVIFIPGLVVYLRATRARDRVGSWALWTMVIVLVLIYFSSFVSPAPSSGRAVGFSALGLWLFVPWSYWIDRHREVVAASPVTPS
ncbi:MAG TPA: metal-dependent hydrolase [Gemmatimonadaceae bacterium]|jgi:hypothetical protein